MNKQIDILNNYREQIQQKTDDYELISVFHKVIGKTRPKKSIFFKMKHKVCGHVYEVRSDAFLVSNARCPLCEKIRHNKKLEEKRRLKLESIFTNTNGEYRCLSLIQNPKDNRYNKLKIKHLKCNQEFEIAYSSLRKKNRKNCLCPFCRDLKRKDEDIIADYREKFLNENIIDYTLNDVIVKRRTDQNGGYKVFYNVTHKTCGNTYNVESYSFLIAQNRCKPCSIGKCAKQTLSILEELVDQVETEKTFEGLIGDKKPLRFDFYIREKNLLIEYDGEFHFFEVFSNDLETQRKYDSLKDDFCRKNGINLLRIPFWYKNKIEKIVNYALEEIDDLNFFSRRNGVGRVFTYVLEEDKKNLLVENGFKLLHARKSNEDIIYVFAFDKDMVRFFSSRDKNYYFTNQLVMA